MSSSSIDAAIIDAIGRRISDAMFEEGSDSGLNGPFETAKEVAPLYVWRGWITKEGKHWTVSEQCFEDWCRTR